MESGLPIEGERQRHFDWITCILPDAVLPGLTGVINRRALWAGKRRGEICDPTPRSSDRRIPMRERRDLLGRDRDHFAVQPPDAQPDSGRERAILLQVLDRCYRGVGRCLSLETERTCHQNEKGSDHAEAEQGRRTGALDRARDWVCRSTKSHGQTRIEPTGAERLILSNGPRSGCQEVGPPRSAIP